MFARRQAGEAFDLCAGFVYSQVLLACVELKILDLVRHQPQSAQAIAAQTGLEPAAALRLLKAARSVRLLSSRSGGNFGLGMRGAAIVANPGLLALIRHHRLFYADLLDPVALLRGTQSATALSKFWGYARGDGLALGDSDVAPYSSLMAASQTLVADALLEAYPFERCAVLMDIGGGEGEFIIRAAARYPHLSFIHFDLPAVSARAKFRFDRAYLGERVALSAGSFLEDELLPGADVMTLIRVMHDHEDDHALRILKAARGALKPGGTLLIAEPLAGTAKAEAVGDAYFAFYLMAMGSGRARTFEELSCLVRRAGFVSIRELPTHLSLQVRILCAQI